MHLKLIEVPPNSADSPQTIDLGEPSATTRPRFRVGRLKRDCDLALQSEYVSKRHFDLVAGEAGWAITDNASRAGTKLNGVRLKAHVAYPVHNGDEIRFCGYQFVILADDSDSRVGGSAELPVIDDDSGFASIISKPGQSWSQLTAASAENKLQLLLEMIRDLRHPVEIEALLRRLIERLFKLIPKARRGTIMVRGCPDMPLGYFVAVTRKSEGVSAEAGMRQGVLEAVLDHQNAVLTEDKQVICVPLVDRDDATIGSLQLESLRPDELFSQRELELLAGASLLVSFAIETDLYQAAVARDRLQQQELRMAREIQRRLLPPPRERFGDYELFATYDAALQVGGDYYDFVELPDGGLALAVGDVSGKGVPASLLMAKISSEIRILLDLGLGPAEVLGRVNQRLTERTSGGGGFITLALLTLDRQRHRLVLANAGHPRPKLRGTDGSIVDLGDAAAGCALGVDATETYREAVYDFPAGAVVLLFSDGVTEARAHDSDVFGMERLQQAIGAAPSVAKDMGLAVLDAIQTYLGDQPNQDDLCLICVSRPATNCPPDAT